MLKSRKEIAVGALCLLIAGFLIAGDTRFVAASQPAMPIVRQTDDRRPPGPVQGRMFRQVLGLDADIRPRPEYAGNVWYSPPLHRSGEIVPGRCDATGDKRMPDRMLLVSLGHCPGS